MKNVSNYEVHSILAAWTEAISSFKRSKEPFIIVGLFCIIILCKTQGCFWQKHINIMYLFSFQRVNKFLHERSVMSNKKSNHPLQILKTIKLKANSNKAKQMNSRVEQSRILCKAEEERSLRSWSAGRRSAAVGESVSVIVSVAVAISGGLSSSSWHRLRHNTAQQKTFQLSSYIGHSMSSVSDILNYEKKGEDDLYAILGCDEHSSVSRFI